ncbi:MAG: hypothetical protein LC793_04510 [Thermomicrobia bacterium]|nr:hypothetical protein [Thermomicrobia bacterium]MCA1724648.1 hypothetical protein [Thermomicrobia bacterium]
MTMLCVTWRDSRLYQRQMDAEGLHKKPTKIVSVGHFVRKDKHSLVIAMEKIEGEWRCVLMIPNENIVRTRFLTELLP